MKHMVDKLVERIKTCSLCYDSDQIVVPENAMGPDDAPRIFLIGEQPHREMLLNDQKAGLEADPSLDRMRTFLSDASVKLSDVFYTTSVQCVPRDFWRRKGRPTLAEAKNCTLHLEALLRLINPKLIVPVGHTPLQSLQWIYKDWRELRQFILNYDVGNVLEKDGVAVYPLLHTSPNTVRLRSERRQVRDWKRIPNLVEAQARKTAAT